MNKSGTTLIELIVVVAIISILAVALGFSYVGWMGKYKVEQATKGIYTDLMDARGRAMQQDMRYFADFQNANANPVPYPTYRIIPDTNNNSILDDNPLPTFPKVVNYRLDETFTGNTISFDKRGLVSPGGSIHIWSTDNPNLDADYDCITVLDIRINMGKWNGATNACDAK